MCFLLSLGEVKYSEVVFLCQISDYAVVGNELWLPNGVSLKNEEILFLSIENAREILILRVDCQCSKGRE